MVIVETIIQNKHGFHVRPCQQFLRMTQNFTSKITVVNADKGIEVDGKNAFSLMQLMALRGTYLQIKAEGDDEEIAAAALSGLVASRFGGID